ncbi:phosphotransferase [Streptomyces thinghirensis]|uniref:Protein kinase domain-containing protein n=1 Tax=Streptomyces thinghirensis TaxID=551547 RepID=A0ABP9SXH8_9ACTN
MGRLLSTGPAAPGTSQGPGALPRTGIDLGSATGLGRHLERRGERLDEYSEVRVGSGRNVVVSLVRPEGHGVLVKQHRKRSDERYTAECAVHSTVLPRLGGPVRVPRLLNTYPEDRILEFEFVRDAQSLADRMTDARPLPGGCFPELGGFLGLLHALSPVSEPAVEDERAQMIGYERVSPEEFSLFSAAEIRVVRLVQSDRRLGLALTRLGRSLRPLGLLHGDFRAENVLVSRDDAGRLSVIDWELSRHSDPAAELGYFIGNLLHRAWYAVRAQRPDVESWQAAVDTRTAELSADTAAFWRGYLETAPERLTLRRPLLPLLVTAHAGSALLSRVVGDVRATGRVTPRDLLVIGRARDLVVHPASSARALLGSGS